MEERAPFVSIKHAPQAAIVTVIISQILTEREVEQMRSTLLYLLDDMPDQNIVLDFTAVHMLCSSAIGFLVEFKKRVDSAQGRLIICCLQSEIRNTPHDKYVHEIFKVSKLDDYFDLAPSVEAALAVLV